MSLPDYDTWKLTAPDERGRCCADCGQPSGEEPTCAACEARWIPPCDECAGEWDAEAEALAHVFGCSYYCY